MCTPDDSERAIERVPGLPGELPEGEQMLWQGSASARAIAIDALHVRAIALYFGLAAIARIGYNMANGEAAAAALQTGLGIVGLGVVCIGILCVIAWAMANRSIVSVTSKRVVIRHGVGVRKYINIPFSQVESLDLRQHKSGVGDIAITTDGSAPIPYLHLWPFARPLRFTKTIPLLRGIPEIASVSNTLVSAMRNNSPSTVRLTASDASEPRPESVPSPVLVTEVS